MLRFHLNIPTTHNHALFDSLRAEGASITVSYRQSASATGRSWEPIAREEDTRPHDGRWRRTADDDVVLSGGWAHPVEIANRVATPLRTRSVHWWGERLAPTTSLRSLARAAWFRAPGLDGILAIGSAATEDDG